MPSHDSSQAALEANHVFIPCIVVWTLGLPLVWGGWVGWMGAGPCQGLANKSHRRLHTCGSKKHLMPSSLKSPLPKDSDIHASSRPEGPAGETWYSLSKHWLHSNQCPALFVVQSLFHVLSNGFCCAGGRSHCFKQNCTSIYLPAARPGCVQMCLLTYVETCNLLKISLRHKWCIYTYILSKSITIEKGKVHTHTYILSVFICIHIAMNEIFPFMIHIAMQ